METESGPVSHFVQSRRILALEIELKHRCVVGGGGGGVFRKVCVGGVLFFLCVWLLLYLCFLSLLLGRVLEGISFLNRVYKVS